MKTFLLSKHFNLSFNFPTLLFLSSSRISVKFRHFFWVGVNCSNNNAHYFIILHVNIQQLHNKQMKNWSRNAIKIQLEPHGIIFLSDNNKTYIH